MKKEAYNQQQLLTDISTIFDGIKQGIDDLHRMTNLVLKESKIISFEQTFCKQCKEPCGRSNAEIFNCMMTGKKIKGKNMQQYTKEHLEEDLKKITINLEEKEKHLRKIMEKIEKGIPHS
jgi:hypothetical protein